MQKIQGMFIICVILSLTEILVSTALDTLAVRIIAVDMLASRAATKSLSCSTAVTCPAKNCCADVGHTQIWKQNAACMHRRYIQECACHFLALWRDQGAKNRDKSFELLPMINKIKD